MPTRAGVKSVEDLPHPGHRLVHPVVDLLDPSQCELSLQGASELSEVGNDIAQVMRGGPGGEAHLVIIYMLSQPRVAGHDDRP